MIDRKNEAHHRKLDEMMEAARETMHAMIDSAMQSGAVSEEMADPSKYLLSKAVITIWGDQRNYASPSAGRKRDIENLSHFI